MSCCGGCGGQEIEKEKSEEKVTEQKPEPSVEPSQSSVGQFDPSKK